jgi:CRISPR-associated exonuclease Cas4
MYAEADLLPLSALQHLVFCERRAALVHVEQLWADNRHTVEGAHAHARVDGTAPAVESRKHIRIVRRLPLHSFHLGLSGVADVVEFRADPEGVALPDVAGRWRPFPVEYKKGKRRKEDAYRVQLCAQALCLEEMLDAAVPEGAVYFGTTRRREAIVFDSTLRAEVRQAAARLHELVASGRTPPAVQQKKCKQCSLVELCMPKLGRRSRSAAAYLRHIMEGGDGPDP